MIGKAHRWRKYLDYLWPVLGFIAVAVSLWILKRELGKVGFDDVVDALHAIPVKSYWLGFISCFAAYAALAWYDQIALLHLRKTLSWWVISVVSFTAYALSHNIGASVFTSGVIRYRAYSRYGLSLSEVVILSAFCSFTFAFGTAFLMGLVLVGEPEVIGPLMKPLAQIPPLAVQALGGAVLAAIFLYVLGSALHFPPLKVGNTEIHYPRLPIALRQLVAAPSEIMGAAAIIYFTLPADVNPGYFIVLGVFLVAFSAGLISNAPGGLGVFEAVFLLAMPSVPKDQLLASLIVFRAFYLLIPLLISCGVVLAVEGRQLGQTLRQYKQERTLVDKNEA